MLRAILLATFCLLVGAHDASAAQWARTMPTRVGFTASLVDIAASDDGAVAALTTNDSATKPGNKLRLWRGAIGTGLRPTLLSGPPHQLEAFDLAELGRPAGKGVLLQTRRTNEGSDGLTALTFDITATRRTEQLITRGESDRSTLVGSPGAGSLAAWTGEVGARRDVYARRRLPRRRFGPRLLVARDAVMLAGDLDSRGRGVIAFATRDPATGELGEVKIRRLDRSGRLTAEQVVAPVRQHCCDDPVDADVALGDDGQVLVAWIPDPGGKGEPGRMYLAAAGRGEAFGRPVLVGDADVGDFRVATGPGGRGVLLRDYGAFVLTRDSRIGARRRLPGQGRAFAVGPGDRVAVGWEASRDRSLDAHAIRVTGLDWRRGRFGHPQTVVRHQPSLSEVSLAFTPRGRLCAGWVTDDDAELFVARAPRR